MKKASDNENIKPDFRRLFESVPGNYLILSPTLSIVAVSDAYLKATMTKRTDIVGLSLFEVFPDNPDDPAATGTANLRASLNRVLQTKEPDTMAVQKYDIQRPAAEGGGFEERFWSPLNTPVLGKDRELLYIIHKVEDVTDFVKLKSKGTEQSKITEELLHRASQMENEILQRAQELQDANKQLREAEKAKSEFFANVSHEFRTPLSLILAPLETLLSQRKSEIPNSQLQLLQVVHNNAIRLLQMVTGLLDFAKVEAGKMKTHPEPTDITALASSVLNEFEALMRGKNIELVSEMKVPDSYIMIDRYLFERILFNLLSNAAKFTLDGGRVTVVLKLTGEKLRLSISDTGIGIAENDKENLFKMFYQAEGSSTRRYDGTGLGLAMVKEFAELMGGSVTVKSTPGKGSTFVVECIAPAANTVPERIYAAHGSPIVPQYVIPQEGETSYEGEEADANNEEQVKLLVCEDNEELSSYIVSLLKDDCHIKVARDGEEGLHMVETWKPDMVLTDVMMPVVNGIEVCRSIKSHPETSGIIVVLLTALTQRDALIKGWEAKADEYLFKPFHPTELVTRMNSLFTVVKERKKAAKFAEQKTMELLRTNSELEAFSYSVSHDLRAPLRVISGFSKILAEEYADKLDDNGNQTLRVINENAARMDQLIDDLLNFSRVSRTELQKQDIDMNALLEDITANIKLTDKNFSAVIRLKELKTAYGDVQLMRQVWINLLSNAIKYSRNKQMPVIEIGCRNIDDIPTYYIKDNGVGFDMQYAGKLFGVFHRMHNSSEFEGTGVGLALVQRIISRHGGRIWADAKVNEGAAFYFTLPGKA